MLQVGGTVHFDYISTNKEKLTPFQVITVDTITFFENLFPSLYKRSGCTSFLGPLKQTWLFWWLVGTWREKSSDLEIWAVVRSGWKKIEEAFQLVQLFSYSMLNSSEVFLNVCSNENSFSWPNNELMICWPISKVWFAWGNCRYQVHLLANKQAPQAPDVFFVVAVTGQLLLLRCSVNPVSLSFLIKLWTAM